MALYFLRSLLGMELDLERNTNNQGLDQLCSLLKEIYQYWDEIGIRMRRRTVSLPDSEQGRQTIPQSQGRPPFVIEKEFLEDLRSCDSYTWSDIARILRISRRTLYSSVKEFKLENLSKYSDFSGDELDALVRRHISQHGSTTRKSYLVG